MMGEYINNGIEKALGAKCPNCGFPLRLTYATPEMDRYSCTGVHTHLHYVRKKKGPRRWIYGRK
jgi:hypothetical protein